MKDTVNTPYKTIRASISYHSNEYIELPDIAIIELSKDEIDKIKLAKSLIKENGFECISISVSSKLMEEGKESEFRSECDQLRITSTGIFAYAQKVSSSDVPTAVTSQFSSLYPNSKAEQWKKEKGNYETKFTEKDTKMCVAIDPSGNVLQ